MAEQTIILDLKVSNEEAVKNIEESKKAIEELKREEAALRKEMDENTISAEEYNQQLTSITVAVEKAKNTQKAYTDALKQNVRQEQAATDSLVSMRAELKKLTTAYDNLSKAERTGAEGKALQEKISSLNKEILAAEESTGRFQRNVGNYAGSISQALGSISPAAANAVKGIKTVDTAAKALAANPLTAAIAAIVLVVVELVKAFKRSDEAMTALKSAFAAFQPIITGVRFVLEKVVETIAKFVAGAAKMVTAVLSLVPAFKEAQDAAIGLVKAEDELEVRERNYTINSAKRGVEIAKLRNQIRQTDKYTTEERIRMADEAIAMEKKDLEEAKANARDRYNIELQKAKQNKQMDDDTKNRLADLKAAMYKAEEDFYTGTARLQAQAANNRNEIVKEAEEAAKKQKEAAKKAADELKSLQDEVLNTSIKVRDAQIAAMKEGVEKEVENRKWAAQKTIGEYSRQMQEIEKKMNGAGTKTKALLQKELNDLRELVKLEQGQMVVDIAKLREKSMEEEYDRQYEAAMKTIELRLSVAKKGSDEELRLKETQLLNAKNRELQNTELTAEQKLLIEEKYESDVAELRRNAAIDSFNAQMDAMNELYSEKIEDAYKNEAEQANVRVEAAEYYYDSLKSMDNETRDLLFENSEAYEREVKRAARARKKAIEDANTVQRQEIADQLGAVASMSGSITDLFNQIAGDNEEMQGFMKVMALGDIMINMAKGIAGAIAAGSGLIFPANIGAIASGVAAVTTGIASAVTLLNQQSTASAPKFATGGYVSGAGTGTSDSIDAKLSNGESVINAKSTRKWYNLLSAINEDGGGVAFSRTGAGNRFALGGYIQARDASIDMEMMRDMMSDAISEIQPVVSVKEITKTQNRVRVKEKLAR